MTYTDKLKGIKLIRRRYGWWSELQLLTTGENTSFGHSQHRGPRQLHPYRHPSNQVIWYRWKFASVSGEEARFSAPEGPLAPARRVWGTEASWKLWESYYRLEKCLPEERMEYPLAKWRSRNTREDAACLEQTSQCLSSNIVEEWRKAVPRHYFVCRLDHPGLEKRSESFRRQVDYPTSFQRDRETVAGSLATWLGRSQSSCWRWGDQLYVFTLSLFIFFWV